MSTAAGKRSASTFLAGDAAAGPVDLTHSHPPPAKLHKTISEPTMTMARRRELAATKKSAMVRAKVARQLRPKTSTRSDQDWLAEIVLTCEQAFVDDPYGTVARGLGGQPLELSAAAPSGCPNGTLYFVRRTFERRVAEADEEHAATEEVDGVPVIGETVEARAPLLIFKLALAAFNVRCAEGTLLADFAGWLAAAAPPPGHRLYLALVGDNPFNLTARAKALIQSVIVGLELAHGVNIINAPSVLEFETFLRPLTLAVARAPLGLERKTHGFKFNLAEYIVSGTETTEEVWSAMLRQLPRMQRAVIPSIVKEFTSPAVMVRAFSGDRATARAAELRLASVPRVGEVTARRVRKFFAETDGTKLEATLEQDEL